MRVGVISDTHIADPRRRAIPAAVMHAFVDVECIVHAGDISCRAVLDELEALAPVYAVTGNVDPPELSAHLPSQRVVDVDGVLIGLTHGHIGVARTTPERALGAFSGTPGVRAVVFGHSHQAYNEMRSGVLLFNPGSPTERRRGSGLSYGLLTVADGAVHGEIRYL